MENFQGLTRTIVVKNQYYLTCLISFAIFVSYLSNRICRKPDTRYAHFLRPFSSQRTDRLGVQNLQFRFRLAFRPSVPRFVSQTICSSQARWVPAVREISILPVRSQRHSSPETSFCCPWRHLSRTVQTGYHEAFCSHPGL